MLVFLSAHILSIICPRFDGSIMINHWKHASSSWRSSKLFGRRVLEGTKESITWTPFITLTFVVAILLFIPFFCRYNRTKHTICPYMDIECGIFCTVHTPMCFAANDD